jgi:hypothetical protein
MSIDRFFIDTYPVTCTNYSAYLRSTGYKPSPDKSYNWLKNWTTGSDGMLVFPPGHANKPVTYLSLAEVTTHPKLCTTPPFFATRKYSKTTHHCSLAVDTHDSPHVLVTSHSPLTTVHSQSTLTTHHMCSSQATHHSPLFTRSRHSRLTTCARHKPLTTHHCSLAVDTHDSPHVLVTSHSPHVLVTSHSPHVLVTNHSPLAMHCSQRTARHCRLLDFHHQSLTVCHVHDCWHRSLTWTQHNCTVPSHRQARQYCAHYGKRLPHSYEWQYAAQGTDWRMYPWGGSDPATASDGVHAPQLVTDSNVCPGPHDVNAHPAGASPFGVLDMAGKRMPLASSCGTGSTMHRVPLASIRIHDGDIILSLASFWKLEPDRKFIFPRLADVFIRTTSFFISQRPTTGNVWQYTDEFVDEHTRAVIVRGGSNFYPSVTSGTNWYAHCISCSSL